MYAEFYRFDDSVLFLVTHIGPTCGVWIYSTESDFQAICTVKWVKLDPRNSVKAYRHHTVSRAWCYDHYVSKLTLCDLGLYHMYTSICLRLRLRLRQYSAGSYPDVMPRVQKCWSSADQTYVYRCSRQKLEEIRVLESKTNWRTQIVRWAGCSASKNRAADYRLDETPPLKTSRVGAVNTTTGREFHR